jgi:hypothetical protein
MWHADTAAVQHVGKAVEEMVFNYLLTWNQNQNPLENTYDVIHLHCGLIDDPTVGQFVYATKTSIINSLAFRGLCNTTCEDDGTILDNLHFLEKTGFMRGLVVYGDKLVHC